MIKNLKKRASQDILKKNYIGRLAYMAKGEPYVVPITYYYDDDNNSIISYASEGHKIESMRNNRTVSLQVDEITSVNHWRSVLVHGLFEELEQIDAKFQLHVFAEGVKKVIAEKDKDNSQFIGMFSSKLESEVPPVVYRINMQRITAKQRDG